ncbi:hypothetical protein NQ317_017969 [Molorchus minor]|uniref:Mitochondrial inner membrane protease ATP23 n=1 Tax=Molorchus minor TaxID=1323400 RepID=A0ABQ9JLR1_9CUCU|nr:hypothetical protein NQ317_017969 [Molorchus minor]
MYEWGRFAFNIKEAHQNCVKSKALSSVLAVRNISKVEAVDAIERVFTKCYSDLRTDWEEIKGIPIICSKRMMKGFIMAMSNN